MDFVTADLHFNHPGILKFERDRFKTTEEHDEFILKSLNSALSPNDTLYVLGDVGFRNEKHGLEYLSYMVRRIECKTKVLVFGNHDHFSKQEAIKMGFDRVHEGPIYYESDKAPGGIILSHEPVREALDNPYVINVHGHIHNGCLKASRFYNVNIAQTNYVPQTMKKFIELAKKKNRTRRETYGREWYYDLYDLKEVSHEKKENIS